MLHSKSNAFFICLAIFWFMMSPASAAQLFSGRWHASGQQPVSIGIIQDGETVALFGEPGRAMLLLAPGGHGRLASGEGKWSFNDAAPIIVNVTIGYRDDQLYLQIAPKAASGTGEFKIIMDRIEPKLANNKI